MVKNKRDKKIRISAYFKKYSWQIAIYIFLFASAALLGAVVPIFLAETIELVTLSEYQKAIYSCAFVIGLAFASSAINVLMSYLYNKYSVKIIKAISFDCAMQAFKLDSTTYSSHAIGNFTERIISDPKRIVSNMSDIIFYISTFLSTGVVLFYVIAMNWVIGIAIILLMITISVSEYFRSKQRNKNLKKQFGLNERVMSITTEIVRSEKDIKTSGLEYKLKNIINDRYEDYYKQTTKTSNQDLWYRSIRNFFNFVLTYGILILGIVLLEKALIAMSTFMLIYSYRGQIAAINGSLGRWLDIVNNMKLSLGRINELFDNKEYTIETFGSLRLENIKGAITFKNVAFSYKEYEYEKDKKTGEVSKKLKNKIPVFKKLNFSIKPNTTVAFVGKSGAGKSTIVGLVSKLILSDKGKILIDNVDIKKLSKDTLRNCISLVNQFPYIFDMTIKENLLLAKEDATEEDLQRAVKESFLDEFVNSLPKKLDTVVGESGVKLSGGQRQRLAIARALLRKSSIIIFDESTSSLDNFAQDHIKKCIDGLKGKSTIIIVAHRLSTIRNVNTIFFLDNGDIIDQGAFDELYQRNKQFKDMFIVENINQKL